MTNINCLNAISKVGLNVLTDDYKIVENFADADAVLVRSQDMKEMDLGDRLLAVARA